MFYGPWGVAVDELTKHFKKTTPPTGVSLNRLSTGVNRANEASPSRVVVLLKA